MYATNVVITAQAPYLSIIYDTFNVLPAIVSVIQLQKITGHTDEQQNLNKYVRSIQQQLHTKPNCVPVRTFPFRNNQRNDSMEQSFQGSTNRFDVQEMPPIFMEPESLSSCSKEPTTSYFFLLRPILISVSILTNALFPCGFLTKIFLSPMRASRPSLKIKKKKS